MKRSLPVDLSLVLSLATVLGMAMAVAGRWPAHEFLGALLAPGLALVYLAGGLPTAWRAVSELWREHVLDIDLLMIAAAIAAAVVGAPFEGAVLLTLFSISTTLEERALGRARRAIEALMALRPETALRRTAGGAVEDAVGLNRSLANTGYRCTIQRHPVGVVHDDGVALVFQRADGVLGLRAAGRRCHRRGGEGANRQGREHRADQLSHVPTP